MNARWGVLPDCVLEDSSVWCTSHQRNSTRCRRIAAAVERCAVLKDVAAELHESGARFSAEAVLEAAREIRVLVEADERNLTHRIESMRERREQVERDDETERAWKMLRDAIDIPSDTAHGPYLADMVCDYISGLTVKLRMAGRELERVKAERDEHLTTLLRASIAVKA